MSENLAQQTSGQSRTQLQLPILQAINLPAPGRVPFSVEFMPPRDDAAENRLWRAAETFHDLGAAFASVTYGAGRPHCTQADTATSHNVGAPDPRRPQH